MRAAVMYDAGNVRFETVPDPEPERPTDAVDNRESLKVMVQP